MKTRIGARTVKTAIAVLLALLVKLILVLAIDIHTGTSWSKIIYTPFFGAIAAAYSMHMNAKASKNQAKIRTMGSLFGGLYGMVVLIICEAIFVNALKMPTDTWYYYLFDYALVAISIIPMIHLTVVTKKSYATWIACLTYLSVTVSIRNDFDDQLHILEDPAANGYIIAIIFALNRILSTVIGVTISLGVNMFRLPHKTKNKDILFCVGIEGMLKDDHDPIVGFANYKLNDLYETGANCTVFTTRIPTTFMHLFGTVKMDHPIVCMSGAALYDAKNKKYLETETISCEVAQKLDIFLEKLNVTPFKNFVENDVLHMYQKEISNIGEEKYFESKKNGPYCFATIGDAPKDSNPLYYLLVENPYVVEMVKKEIETNFNDELIVQIYDYFDHSSDGTDLKYLKIYSKKVLELNVLKKYTKENSFRIAGLTTSNLANHLLDNSEIALTNTEYNSKDVIYGKTYKELFKEVSRIYYSKEYARKEVVDNE